MDLEIENRNQLDEALLTRPMVQVQCSRLYFGYKRISKPGGGVKTALAAAQTAVIR